MIHQEALASKTLPINMKSVLQTHTNGCFYFLKCN